MHQLQNHWCQQLRILPASLHYAALALCLAIFHSYSQKHTQVARKPSRIDFKHVLLNSQVSNLHNGVHVDVLVCARRISNERRHGCSTTWIPNMNISNCKWGEMENIFIKCYCLTWVSCSLYRGNSKWNLFCFTCRHAAIQHGNYASFPYVDYITIFL